MSTVQLQQAPLHTLLPSHEDIPGPFRSSLRSYMDHPGSNISIPTSSSSSSTTDDPFHGLLTQDFHFPASTFDAAPYRLLPNPRPPPQSKTSALKSERPKVDQPQKRKRSTDETPVMPSSSRPRLHQHGSSHSSHPGTSHSSQYASLQGHERSNTLTGHSQYPAPAAVPPPTSAYPIDYAQPQMGMLPNQGIRDTPLPLERSRNAWSEGAWSTSPHMSEASNPNSGMMYSGPTGYPGDNSTQLSSSWHPSHSHSVSNNMLPSMTSSNLQPRSSYGYGQMQPDASGRARGSSYPLAQTSSNMNPDYRMSLDPSSAHQRSKPQCWDHGCNGREFSTFSNLLRHQREKNGKALKSYCPRCGAEFTRSTARTNHLLQDKCKSRPSSEGGGQGSSF